MQSTLVASAKKSSGSVKNQRKFVQWIPTETINFNLTVELIWIYKSSSNESYVISSNKRWNLRKFVANGKYFGVKRPNDFVGKLKRVASVALTWQELHRLWNWKTNHFYFCVNLFIDFFYEHSLIPNLILHDSYWLQIYFEWIIVSSCLLTNVSHSQRKLNHWLIRKVFLQRNQIKWLNICFNFTIKTLFYSLLWKNWHYVMIEKCLAEDFRQFDVSSRCRT